MAYTLIFLAGLLSPIQDDTRVGKLVEQLELDDLSAREAAEVALVKLGEKIVPELQKELAGSDDAEIKARLRRVISRLKDLQWETNLEAALKRAAKNGKKVLVLSAPSQLFAPT